MCHSEGRPKNLHNRLYFIRGIDNFRKNYLVMGLKLFENGMRIDGSSCEFEFILGKFQISRGQLPLRPSAKYDNVGLSNWTSIFSDYEIFLFVCY